MKKPKNSAQKEVGDVNNSSAKIQQGKASKSSKGKSRKAILGKNKKRLNSKDKRALDSTSQFSTESDDDIEYYPPGRWNSDKLGSTDAKEKRSTKKSVKAKKDRKLAGCIKRPPTKVDKSGIFRVLNPAKIMREQRKARNLRLNTIDRVRKLVADVINKLRKGLILPSHAETIFKGCRLLFDMLESASTKELERRIKELETLRNKESKNGAAI